MGLIEAVAAALDGGLSATGIALLLAFLSMIEFVIIMLLIAFAIRGWNGQQIDSTRQAVGGRRHARAADPVNAAGAETGRQAAPASHGRVA